MRSLIYVVPLLVIFVSVLAESEKELDVLKVTDCDSDILCPGYVAGDGEEKKIEAKIQEEDRRYRKKRYKKKKHHPTKGHWDYAKYLEQEQKRRNEYRRNRKHFVENDANFNVFDIEI